MEAIDWSTDGAGGPASDPVRVGDRPRVLVTVSLTLVATVLTWFNYPAVLPAVAAEWGLSGVAAGALFAAFQAGYVLAIVPAGRLADRLPRRWVIAAGAVGSALATLGFALTATGPIVGAGWRALAGACTAGVYVPGMRLVADWYRGDDRGRAMGVYVGSFSAGSAAAYVLGPALANAVGFRLALAITGAGGLIAGPLLLAITREHPNATQPSGGFDLGALRRRTYGYAVGVYAGHNWELFAVRAWIGAFLLSAPAIAGRPNGETLAGAVALGFAVLLGRARVADGDAADSDGRGAGSRPDG